MGVELEVHGRVGARRHTVMRRVSGPLDQKYVVQTSLKGGRRINGYSLACMLSKFPVSSENLFCIT